GRVARRALPGPGELEPSVPGASGGDGGAPCSPSPHPPPVVSRRGPVAQEMVPSSDDHPVAPIRGRFVRDGSRHHRSSSRQGEAVGAVAHGAVSGDVVTAAAQDESGPAVVPRLAAAHRKSYTSEADSVGAVGGRGG